MDKKTYEALKIIIKGMRSGSMDEVWNKDMEKGFDELPKIEGWIDEVAKEYEECENQDANGNACWNCESGMGKCGTAQIIKVAN